MKSYVCFLTVVLLLMMVPSVFAAWTITEDWSADYTASQIYGCAYNATTGHVLLAAAATLPIYNASDGTATGSSLTMPVGSGTIFAITCAEDGVIFAWDYTVGALYRWADESATAETLTLTGASPIFARCLRAYGSGNNTRIYLAGGGDDSQIQLITTDGASWTVEDLIAAPASKSGVFAVPPAFTTVYGIQPWSATLGFPRRFDFTGSAWEVNTGFVAEGPTPGTTSEYCVGGDYIPAEGGEPAFVYIFYYNNGQLWALNADTGAHIAGLDYTIPGFNSYAMNVQADTTNKKIYYGSRRSATMGGAGTLEGVFGRLSYSVPEPTPWEAAVEMDWQIYE